ncbi:MAG: hypothetical protein HETSPECPRED_000065 [Heterodermia speciosa]|uniref:Carboxylic ester hydrolase n=1 Tax=Heterodermia speciosa TaxID=116794 RepID=A0A8H3HUJ0_9LECA|nr:MAG: hypothetical protein HETSPECPRED_000065 [Heterodermia speciosa]
MLSISQQTPTQVLQTGAYYNFSNIRYAAPPLKNLRFRDPQPPLQDREHGVLDGTKNVSICPQAAPASWNWDNAGLPDGQVIPIGNSTLPESEDCLFLDVVVPIPVYHNRRRKLAPVLVNIHGGGFFIGDKTTLYDPQGLLGASKNEIVFVSMNYRLTAFGFLGGLGNATSNSTSPNAGLLDQRFALKWIQKYISLFGGDHSRVTILGESGGGASVMFHTIAYGGSRPSENHLFHQAIGQSPGPQVGKGNNQQIVSNAFLAALNVSTVDEARNLPTETLMRANRKIEASTPYFGPFVDGDLIPDLPSRLYTSGRHIKNLRIMAGHNANEARLFIPPTSNSQTTFDAFLTTRFPTATAAQLDYINHTLYPPPNPNTSYTTQNARLSILDADVYNLCWTVLLASRYAPRAYNYIFAVPPAYHAQDLAYTFYNGAGYQHDVNVTVAHVLQRAVTNFVRKGNPNGEGLPSFPAWTEDVEEDSQSPGSDDAKVIRLTNNGFPTAREEAVGRCGWWFGSSFAGSN